MKFLLSLSPVLLFLYSLYLLESFKLVRSRTIFLCLFWGVAAALISYFVNTLLVRELQLDHISFSKYFAPATEEIIKSLAIVFIIKRKHVGFMVDAAIYGFAAGTGFALAENLFYLTNYGHQAGWMVWMLRGFGTALMHGGCTAIAAMIVINGVLRNRLLIWAIMPGLVAAMLLHAAYNQFWLNAFLQTAFTFTILPIVFTVVFSKGSATLQNWMEIEFSSEVALLLMIRKGQFNVTRPGMYLTSLRKYFSPEMIVDLYNFISLYLELSIMAKTNLMLREVGIESPDREDLQEKLAEWKLLRKQIGTTGELALQPLFRLNQRDLWKLTENIK